MIYCYDDKQIEIATNVRQELQEKLSNGIIKSVYQTKNVSTDIRKATIFFPAHKEHRDYLDKNPNGYCNHRIRLKEWPK